jgi:FkbM family methyltransferase
MILTSILDALVFCFKIGADWTTRSLLLSQLIRRGLAVRGRIWYSRIVAEQKTNTFNLRTPQFRQLHLRTQDMPMLLEIFKRQDYCLPLEKSLNESDIVVDLGANVGLASIFFHEHYFPNARFIAVEPSPKNIAVLQKNLAANIQKAEIVPVAVSTEIGLVCIDDTEVGYNVNILNQKKAQNTEGGENTEVLTLTMQRIIEDLKINRIDLLKMDIEGTEKDVLRDATSWLSIVHTMVVELHGDYTEEHLRRDIEPLGFQISKTYVKHLYLAKRVG